MIRLNEIFTIPIWSDIYPNFNLERDIFIDAIKEFKSKGQENIKVSNVFGYQSPKNLHEVKELHPLLKHIFFMAQKSFVDLNINASSLVINNCWANVNDRRQCINSSHIHDGVLSGVAYIKCPEKSGKLVIKNPLINELWKSNDYSIKKNQFTLNDLKIEPKEGLILIFPSYLPHHVETNDHDKERISISFNISC